MSSDFEQKLEKYAEVILKIGLNLQPKQRLLIGGPTADHDGVSFEMAPLVRIIAKKAYLMGARLVDVVWGDEQLRRIRLKYGPSRSLKEYPKWRIDSRLEISQAGDAHLSFNAPNPDLLSDIDPAKIVKFQLHIHKHLHPVLNLLRQYALNWLIITAPTKAWANKMFPDIPSDERISNLWEVIFKICRINEEDPISAWETHKDNLHKQCNVLNQKQYKTLKLTSSDTNLTIGLPKDHIWNGGSVKNKDGIEFVPNLPTEEIFTLPHREKVEGVITTTKPVLIQGNLVENIIFRFSEGRIVEASAKIGDEVIKKTIELDEGAHRLGEIALVPYSSPISATGLLFYNGLIDENASNHIAIGAGFRSSLKNGDSLTDEEFQTAGGNESIIHIDFMIGSKDMNVDGIEEDGTVEPIMRNGEWAFKI